MQAMNKLNLTQESEVVNTEVNTLILKKEFE